MKKLYFLLMLVVALAFTSCESCENEDGTNAPIQYNIEVGANGEGNLVMSYPTGKLNLKGAAKFTATSAMEDTAAVNAPCFKAVLANPNDYSEETVEFANQVNSAFNVDTLEGTWHVDVVGYAKWNNIYLVIDEHWPAESDTVAPCDSLAVDTVVAE